ncbi:MAG: zinc-ribbon domain-containing protein [Lentisphaerae bacterium]|jgi:hypothetical protein|nr:zinc-ribbon domain-containing protein [Lentisphaerota bacterium]
MTIKKSRFITCLTVLLAFVLYLYAESILVCGKCGYEISERSNFCGHCGAPVAVTDTAHALPDGNSEIETSAAQAGKTQSDDDIVNKVVRQAFDEDIATARKYAQTGHPLQSLAPLQNARALAAVAGSANFPADAVNNLTKSITDIHASSTSTLITCPRCNGDRRIPLKKEIQGLQGETTSIQTEVVRCPKCSGAGQIRRTMTPGELAVILEKGRKAYREKNLLAGNFRIGEAWIPNELVEKIDIHQKARLSKLTALPCRDCHGFGKQACRQCNGTGMIRCTAPGCVDGMVKPEPPPTVTGAGRQQVQRIESPTRRLSEPCQVCKGTAEVACSGCNGTSSVICSRCKGTGMPPNCRRCRSEGIVECRKCRGTGIDRDGASCPDCAGEGLELCKTCGGSGYD